MNTFITEAQFSAMSLDEFAAAIKKLDWWYQMSDDHRAWAEGERQFGALQAFLQSSRATPAHVERVEVEGKRHRVLV